jgi:hypothetical protein
MFMYRYIKVLLSLFVVAQLCCMTAGAQVSIIMYPLPQQQLKPADMFRADVLNAGTASQVYFIGTITQKGQKVVSAKSQVITLNTGSTQLNETMLAPAYSFFSSAVEQTGSLPYGNYTICLKAYLLNGIEETAIACEDIELMPLSPPLLLNPENESSIIEEYPLLVWLPPMPVGKEKVVYDLKLVEIMPNQTAYDAIQRNFALLEQKNISGTSLQYPANAMKLDVGKKYAWKVNAYTADRKLIGETEVWWFTKDEVDVTLKDIVVNENYIIPENTANSGVVFIGRSLRVYIEDYPDNLPFRFKILGKKKKEINTENVKFSKDSHGRFTIALDEKLSLKNGAYYTFDITMPDGAHRYIFFRYIKR